MCDEDQDLCDQDLCDEGQDQDQKLCDEDQDQELCDQDQELCAENQKLCDEEQNQEEKVGENLDMEPDQQNQGRLVNCTRAYDISYKIYHRHSMIPISVYVQWGVILYGLNNVISHIEKLKYDHSISIGCNLNISD